MEIVRKVKMRQASSELGGKLEAAITIRRNIAGAYRWTGNPKGRRDWSKRENEGVSLGKFGKENAMVIR